MRIRRPIDPTHATLHEAIEYLVSACDGAVRRDGHGFGADHVRIGHQLADAHHWGPRRRARARGLVRYYRAQLQRAGFNTGQLQDQSKPARTSRRRLSAMRPCWATDPSGLHHQRYWNGARWTQLVA